MSLTRKYYKMIAQCIKDSQWSNNPKHKGTLDKHKLINDLSKEFKRDNINFNYTTFEDACK